MSDYIAIIPARGGSKRLPRKNIIPLGGKPLLQRVIECCLDTGFFQKVIVSTEDAEIEKIALESGAYIHSRNIDLAQDKSTVVDVCLDVLSFHECVGFCCVYATAALLTPDTLIKSAEHFLLESDTNGLMGTAKYNYSPLQALKVDDGGYAQMLMPEFMKVQSQNHPKTKVSNGTFYWAKKTTFINEKTFYSSKLKVFDVPESETCDLDTPQDFEDLKRLFNKRNES